MKRWNEMVLGKASEEQTLRGPGKGQVLVSPFSKSDMYIHTIWHWWESMQLEEAEEEISDISLIQVSTLLYTLSVSQRRQKLVGQGILKTMRLCITRKTIPGAREVDQSQTYYLLLESVISRLVVLLSLWKKEKGRNNRPTWWTEPCPSSTLDLWL